MLFHPQLEQFPVPLIQEERWVEKRVGSQRYSPSIRETETTPDNQIPSPEDC